VGAIPQLGCGTTPKKTNALMNLQELIEEGRFSEVDDRWLDEMSAGKMGVEDFLNIARLLGRHKEKERAGVLLGFLAENYLEKDDWHSRYRVLTEISRHTAKAAKIEDLKDDIEQALEHVYPNSPSLSQVLRHFHFYDTQTPEEIKPILEKAEPWLTHDVGHLFYEPRRGVGRVREININLGLIRLDFEGNKEAALDVADADLVPLTRGHVLREKVEQPDSLRERALQSPDQVLGQLLQQMNRPMSPGEIKECLASVVGEKHWSKWWNAAKKNHQVLVEGKGAQALYSWTASSSAADAAIRKAFQEADLKNQMELAKQHATRSPELRKLFEEHFLIAAQEAGANQKWNIAVELLEFFSKAPISVDPGYDLEHVLKTAESTFLLESLDNPNLKLKVLEEYFRIDADGSMELFRAAFLKEDNPRVLAYVFQTLEASSPEMLDPLFEQIFRLPHSHSGVFTWIAQRGEDESNSITPRLAGKFLITLLSVLDDREFTGHKNKIKKALESGLLINVLSNIVESEQAKKIIELIEHTRAIEDYRRERWTNTIRIRFPEFKQKEESIFSTREATEKKRGELEHLVKVELPKNRKAVGEAAALGDLSENHEYKAARERQDYLINRVQQLQTDLARVRLLEPGKTESSEVRPGTRVTLTQNGNKVVVTILGPWDSNPQENVYSYQSPIGISLLGKMAGDEVQYNDSTWNIERIDPWE
jgi:transcription elongation GreA/GreB family factor